MYDKEGFKFSRPPEKEASRPRKATRGQIMNRKIKATDFASKSVAERIKEDFDLYVSPITAVAFEIKKRLRR